MDVLVVLSQLEQLRQGHHPIALDWLRIREVLELLVADQGLYLLIGEIMYELADVRVLRIPLRHWLGVRALIVLDLRIVPDHRHAILRQDDVQLQRRNAQLQRVDHRLLGLLRPLTATTTVRLQIKTLRQLSHRSRPHIRGRIQLSNLLLFKGLLFARRSADRACTA